MSCIPCYAFGKVTMKKILSLLVLFSAYTQVAYAGLVNCGGTSNGGFRECGLCDLVTVAMNVLDFLVTTTAVLATLLFINAGILYLFSGGEPGKIARAHKIFTSTLIGFVIVLAAWLIIDLLMAWFFTGDLSKAFVGDWNTVLCPGSGVVAP